MKTDLPKLKKRKHFIAAMSELGIERLTITYSYPASPSGQGINMNVDMSVTVELGSLRPESSVKVITLNTVAKRRNKYKHLFIEFLNSLNSLKELD